MAKNKKRREKQAKLKAPVIPDPVSVPVEPVPIPVDPGTAPEKEQPQAG